MASSSKVPQLRRFGARGPKFISPRYTTIIVVCLSRYYFSILAIEMFFFFFFFWLNAISFFEFWRLQMINRFGSRNMNQNMLQNHQPCHHLRLYPPSSPIPHSRTGRQNMQRRRRLNIKLRKLNLKECILYLQATEKRDSNSSIRRTIINSTTFKSSTQHQGRRSFNRPPPPLLRPHRRPPTAILPD
jgi:hypothetical protein